LFEKVAFLLLVHVRMILVVGAQVQPRSRVDKGSSHASSRSRLYIQGWHRKIHLLRGLVVILRGKLAILLLRPQPLLCGLALDQALRYPIPNTLVLHSGVDAMIRLRLTIVLPCMKSLLIVLVVRLLLGS
jgi:hypothetical protein